MNTEQRAKEIARMSDMDLFRLFYDCLPVTSNRFTELHRDITNMAKAFQEGVKL